jgi:hypothetical protein
MMNILIWLLLAQAPPAPEIAFDELQERTKVKRVYVDKFTAGEGAEQLRDLLLAALHRTKLFIVTENADRADAFLRGGGEDTVYTEEFQYRDGVDGRIQLGALRTGGNRNSRSLGASVGEDDSQRQTERKQEAKAALRLVNREGDLIWATTKESRGSKVKSAAVDLVERIVEQLLADFRPGKTVTAAR